MRTGKFAIFFFKVDYSIKLLYIKIHKGSSNPAGRASVASLIRLY